MPRYDEDLAAWAVEQAALLRAGRFAELDVENLADEIAAVARAEQRELAGELGRLLGHQLLQQHGAGRADVHEAVIHAARASVRQLLRESPSLRGLLDAPDPAWLDVVWSGAVARALAEAPDLSLPADCPWSALTPLALA